MALRVISSPTPSESLAVDHAFEQASHGSNQHVEVSDLPAAPRTVEETGLPLLLISELALKVMHQHGLTHLHELSVHLKLSAALIDNLFMHLRKEALIDVRRRGTLDGDVQYQLTLAGRNRAAEALTRNLYSGPAPVPLAAYAARVEAQSVSSMGVTQRELEQVFANVVVRPEVRDQLGAAMNSRRAILLYGPPGAGKTYLCEQMARLLTGHIAVPHAIEVDGEIIRVFDPLVHHEVPATDVPCHTIDSRSRTDARWVLCERPMVMAGGELTLDMLDLVYDARAGYYQAPPHFKANNGIFLVDDLGRQLVTPRQLLNRWILPMEHRHDYLMLRNGSKFRIPFDTMLFFSTNMQPSEVADEAFLRRIGYKIFVGEVAVDDYRRILREVCDEYKVPCDEEVFDILVEGLHEQHGRPLLACIPRDLVGQIVDYAAYHGREPELTPDMLHWAWHNYFATQLAPAAAANMERTS
jgi:predicted ATPase with chaperone activity